jgi:hypothetical protein
MWIRWGCLCLQAGLVAACDNPPPSISAVTPSQAYSADEVTLTVVGDNFLPASILDPDRGNRIAVSDGFRIRVSDGALWAELADVAWLSPHQMTGWLASASAKELRPGPLDVQVMDPRDQQATLPAGFWELGPDQTPPVIAFDSPTADAALTPGMLLRGTFYAADVPPGRLSSLAWTYLENDRPPGIPIDSSCFLPPLARESYCSFQAPISPQLKEGDVVTIVATAQDSASPPNLSRNQLSIHLRAAPTLRSIRPARGGTMGGTDILVKGTGFAAGTTASVDDVPLFPDGGIVVDSTTLSGHVPPHAAGEALLRVHTPLGDAAGAVTFVYVSPPQIDGIVPEVGSVAGGTPVTIKGRSFSPQTQIYFGPVLTNALPLAEPSFADETSIVGRAPAGLGRTTVWAFDAELGFTELADGFTWSAP